MNISNIKTIIYKAASNVVLTVTFTNSSAEPLELNCISTDTVYFNSLGFIANATFSIPLSTGDVVMAWGNTSITYDLFINNIAVNYTPVVDTALDNLKTAAQSAVGVAIGSLTAAQQRALLGVLLYKADAIDDLGRIKKLNTWAK
jgi:hypothetical protein